MAVVGTGFILGLIGVVLAWVIVIGFIACVIYVIYTEDFPTKK
jgi:hypothetical protein